MPLNVRAADSVSVRCASGCAPAANSDEAGGVPRACAPADRACGRTWNDGPGCPRAGSAPNPGAGRGSPSTTPMTAAPSAHAGANARSS